MAKKPQATSAADSHWVLADEYADLANDPTASQQQRETARLLHARAIADAQAAEAAGR